MRYDRKKKLCVGCDTMKYIYARKMCQECYRRSQKPIKQSPKNVKPAFGFSGEKELFLYLWDNLADKRCPISGKPLKSLENTSRFWACFAHILPKGLYGKFRLNPDNIMVVHPDVHSLIDAGTEEQRFNSGYDFSVFFNKKEELKRLYSQII